MIDAKYAYDDEVARNYDADREWEEHWRLENEFVQGYFLRRCNGLLLDVPIGTGRFLDFYPSDANVVGVDVSPHMIDVAREKLRSIMKCSAELRISDARSMPFLHDGSVDVVVCFRLFHLIQDVDRLAVLKEFYRVARGEVLLQVYLDPPKLINLRGFVSRVVRKFVRCFSFKPSLRNNVSPWSHIKAYSLAERELLALCGKAKLKVVGRHSLCHYQGGRVAVFVLQRAG